MTSNPEPSERFKSINISSKWERSTFCRASLTVSAYCVSNCRFCKCRFIIKQMSTSSSITSALPIECFVTLKFLHSKITQTNVAYYEQNPEGLLHFRTVIDLPTGKSCHLINKELHQNYTCECGN